MQTHTYIYRYIQTCTDTHTYRYTHRPTHRYTHTDTHAEGCRDCCLGSKDFLATGLGWDISGGRACRLGKMYPGNPPGRSGTWPSLAWADKRVFRKDHPQWRKGAQFTCLHHLT